jgi:hypothetical protein
VALIVLTDESKYTLPLALANLSGEHVQDTELMLAGAVVTVLPVLLLFLFVQRHYIAGILMGRRQGVKLGACLLMALLASGTAPLPTAAPLLADAAQWQAVPAAGVEMHIVAASGPHGEPGLRIDYDFHGHGGWAAAKRTVPIVLPPRYEIRFLLFGNGPRNNLELKLTDRSGDNVWWHVDRAREWPVEWTPVRIKQRQVTFAWGPNPPASPGGGELHEASAIELTISAAEGGRGSIWVTGLEIVEVPPLASGAVTPTAVADVSEPAHLAPAALDADAATAWRPGPGGGTLTVDLGGLRELGGVTLVWSARGARRFDLQLSSDGKSFTSGREVVRGGALRSELMLPDAEARFLRLRCPPMPAATTAAASPADRAPPRVRCDARRLPRRARRRRAARHLAARLRRGDVLDGGGRGGRPGGVARLRGRRRRVGLPGLQPRALPPSRRPPLHLGRRDRHARARGRRPAAPHRHLEDARRDAGDRARRDSRRPSLVDPRALPPARRLERAPARRSRAGGTAAAGGPALSIPQRRRRRLAAAAARLRRRAAEGRGAAAVAVDPPPQGCGTLAFDEGTLRERLAAGDPPGAPEVDDATRLATAALRWSVGLPAHGTLEMVAAIPYMEPTALTPAATPVTPARFAAALAAEQQTWRAALDRVGFELPGAAAPLLRSVRSSLAWILVTATVPPSSPARAPTPAPGSATAR